MPTCPMCNDDVPDMDGHLQEKKGDDDHPHEKVQEMMGEKKEEGPPEQQ